MFRARAVRTNRLVLALRHRTHLNHIEGFCRCDPFDRGALASSPGTGVTYPPPTSTLEVGLGVKALVPYIRTSRPWPQHTASLSPRRARRPRSAIAALYSTSRACSTGANTVARVKKKKTVARDLKRKALTRAANLRETIATTLEAENDPTAPAGYVQV
ncbi:hypothetical protein CTheo_7703 [Ceratobasidium theobromae]|uniref:Uncharacterized protein n=1 Tax=Ceratobasidium theobromae TaxID=1582974 RepID=A0A5N5QAP4_9AGAM|nr:hypothetical protein CTheo_7703 [Ceratobasidium theobromae]